MPIVRVEWFAGRTEDQKAAVAQGIAEVMRTQGGVRPESLFIVFEDVERSNWATGGVLASRATPPPPAGPR
jgi:4-oxalocrotonate tautomerase